MNKTLRINVRLTLKDIRKMSFSYQYRGVLGRIYLITSSMLSFSFIVGVLFFTVIFFVEEQFHKYICWIPIFVLSIPFSLLFFNSTAIMKYFKTKNMLKTLNKSIGELERYEFTYDGIRTISSKGDTNIRWEYISKIVELKPCFLIQFTGYYYFIIPKRCFKDKVELNEFLDFLYSILHRKKLKIKRYRFNKFSPDYGGIVQVEGKESLYNTSIIEVTFANTKGEIIKANLIAFYRMPFVIICTIISPQCIYRLFNPVNMSTTTYVLTISPIIITLAVPILLYLIIRGLKKNSFFDKKYTYKFYDNGFKAIFSNDTSFISWYQIEKVINLKSEIVLFLTTNLIHIFPKRAFSENPDDYKILKKLISEKVKKTRNQN